MKKIKMPHTYVLIFIMIIIVAALTYIVPAGQYDRAEDAKTGRVFVVADSYHQVEQSPVSPFGVFKAVPKGMEEAGQIIFFVLIIGGAFGVLQATGAVDAGIGSVVKSMTGREKLVIPVIMTIFSLAGAILGTAEEALPFYPIVIAMALALGFDTITGTAMVLLGAGAGFAGAFLNPFTIGIAQGISGLPLFSGIGYRLICYVVILAAGIIYVYRYASKIHKNPELSPMYEEDRKKHDKFDLNDLPEFNTKHKMVMSVLVIGLVILGYGIVNLGFYITELAAMFLIIGIATGIVGGLKINEIAEEFIHGAEAMVYGAIIIGLARAITVVMTEGSIMDTIIYSMGNVVSGMPGALSAVGMFIVQSMINIIIPSGSGQAAVSMPIMAPMADVVGITRQTAVLAFQFGDGITNMISPTSGYFMAALAIGGVKWDKWAKWMFPLFLIWSGIAAVLVAISVLINYGPF
ncbi:YfcC family protein [Clostridium sp.]|uniref:YfcC family protein n=1 Tax=Clostridium sp. TaxID=1506 RepID=UPI001A3D900A|nr:YfcC family protein [Clostridium sp.]MBK5234516.1 putative basic amino acid antiporter YfcC [Clostridium sp.]